MIINEKIKDKKWKIIHKRLKKREEEKYKKRKETSI